MVSNPGKTITVRNIPELTHRAYLRAFTNENIISSFKKTGICPLNRLAFSDEYFTPSAVTDQPLLERDEDNANNKIEDELTENENGHYEQVTDKNKEEPNNDINNVEENKALASSSFDFAL